MNIFKHGHFTFNSLFTKLIYSKSILDTAKSINVSDKADVPWLSFFSDYLFKLLLIGDSGVGKSCLLLRFAVSFLLLFLLVIILTTLGFYFFIQYTTL